MDEVINRIRQELKENIDPKTKETGKYFFKEEIKFYGVKTNIVSKIADKYFREIKELSKREIFNLCEDLLKSDYNEEAWIAFEWSFKLHKQYQPSDFNMLERWVEDYVNNWAKCDTLCNHTIGIFVEMYPHFKSELLKWAHSKNRWVRRASSVTLILPARRGKFLSDVFKICNILLLDQDDMVQKGYGWLLKEASKSHLEETFEYVLKNKDKMPRTALRYAIEKMPNEMKKEAMAK